MSESRTSGADSYFDDNATTICNIGRKIHELTSYESAVSIVIDPISTDVLNSSGHTTAEEILEHVPGLDLATAERLAHVYKKGEEANAQIAHNSLSALLGMHEIAQVSQDLKDTNLSEEERRARFASHELTMPDTAEWRKIEFETTVDEILTMTSMVLSDASGTSLASWYKLTFSDGSIAKQAEFCFIGECPVETGSSTWIEQDVLRDRMAGLLNIPDALKVAQMISGSLPLQVEDLDAELSDMWLRYQDTSRATEVGPLLDEVRDRFIGVREAIAMRQELGSSNDRPTLQELLELQEYLS